MELFLFSTVLLHFPQILILQWSHPHLAFIQLLCLELYSFLQNSNLRPQILILIHKLLFLIIAIVCMLHLLYLDLQILVRCRHLLDKPLLLLHLLLVFHYLVLELLVINFVLLLLIVLVLLKLVLVLLQLIVTVL